MVRDSVSLQIKKLRDDVVLPKYMSEAASGMDLSAVLDAPIDIKPQERILIPTGIAVAIPLGFEGQVRPRSGMALSHGLTVLNAPGTIDADYRGEIKVLLINLSQESITITSKQRIAQLVIAPVTRVDIVTVDEELPLTQRGSLGFGSTGSDHKNS